MNDNLNEKSIQNTLHKYASVRIHDFSLHQNYQKIQQKLGTFLENQSFQITLFKKVGVLL